MSPLPLRDALRADGDVVVLTEVMPIDVHEQVETHGGEKDHKGTEPKREVVTVHGPRDVQGHHR
jgi:hypothetical protein